MTYILGLTGGIASGKSTVSRFLREKGARIIDGDVVAREVVQKNSIGLNEIVKIFGENYLTSTGELNRKKLGSLVFNDKSKLKQLTDITGPLIHKQIENLVAEAKKTNCRLLVLDIPLLFEGNYQKYCDSVMCVWIPQKLQIERMMARNGYTEKQAQQRILSQMSNDERCSLADVLIDNSKQVEETLEQVLKWLETMDLV
ncbi:dephospho-CoA kinase [Liquorilactobacillus mali]|uniref:dephospho-CoA kinase n=1 Tax=Liquorilactobacillus mali TaxID=1618 RepID=UPI002651701F|nr:dephospho-CoA kinase [Liquorilactobacillus mali]MDN7144324.1 dephospho-CoA kinase [Liquorilactobacillus mali]